MRSVRHWQAIAVSVWAVSIAGGAGYLAAHGVRAGETAAAPGRLDESFKFLGRTPGVWTIVMAAHPRCPCTRASVDELERALVGATRPYELIVLAFCPATDAARGPDPDSTVFTDTPAIRRLVSLDGVRTVDDPGGLLAARFGALTSGHTLMYDPSGRLCFSGGLTPSRAHVGPNTGAFALRALLRNDEPVATESPVYGCPLENTNSTASIDLGGCTANGEPVCTP